MITATNVISTILQWSVILETVLIVFGSIVVLQHVLEKCSTGLRIAFMVYPIAASIKLIDVLFFDIKPTLADGLMYFGILVGINWIWNQKELFKEFEYLLIETRAKSRGFFSVDELKCIACCFAVYTIKKIGYCPSLTGTVCSKLQEDRRKNPR